MLKQIKVLYKKKLCELLDLPAKNDFEIRDKAIIEILYSCGLRRNELVKLNVHNIDIKNNELRVNNGNYTVLNLPSNINLLQKLWV